MEISLGRFKVCLLCIICGLHYLVGQCCQTFQHSEGPLFLRSPGSFLIVPQVLIDGLPDLSSNILVAFQASALQPKPMSLV